MKDVGMKATCDDPYGGLLCNYLQQEFPGAFALDKGDMLEALANAMVGTKETRYGPLPSPEHLVETRKTIREAIAADKPIPVLVPWGSVKADFSAGLDMAEASAIKRLVCLAKTVRGFYPPGVEMVIRIEDISGYSLFELERDMFELRSAINSYSADLKALVAMMGGQVGVRGQLESEMRNAPGFDAAFRENLLLMERYLLASQQIATVAPDHLQNLDEYKALAAKGWRGVISLEQRSHYLDAYRRLYADWDESRLIRRLALYFAGAMTRHQLDMVGRQEHWDRFVQLAFVPPIKGLPEGYNSRYVYWRTLPLSCARTHIPPWRAKGYVKIAGDSVTPKLTTFGDRETIDALVPSKIKIETGGRTIVLGSDYVITA
jgi:hypothetical protein